MEQPKSASGGIDLWQALQMATEAVQTHVKNAAHCAAADNKGSIQVEKDRTNCQHLAAVVPPDLQHLAEECYSVHSRLLSKSAELTLYPQIALLQVHWL